MSRISHLPTYRGSTAFGNFYVVTLIKIAENEQNLQHRLQATCVARMPHWLPTRNYFRLGHVAPTESFINLRINYFEVVVKDISGFWDKPRRPEQRKPLLVSRM